MHERRRHSGTIHSKYRHWASGSLFCVGRPACLAAATDCSIGLQHAQPSLASARAHTHRGLFCRSFPLHVLPFGPAQTVFRPSIRPHPHLARSLALQPLQSRLLLLCCCRRQWRQPNGVQRSVVMSLGHSHSSAVGRSPSPRTASSYSPWPWIAHHSSQSQTDASPRRNLTSPLPRATIATLALLPVDPLLTAVHAAC